ncbi:MAG: GNAT family N-acetyltransferase [Steroidobacteraceae bacterium]|nr:GNAT family N-acetyltransferase [Steroidobacteraceae bacterium]
MSPSLSRFSETHAAEFSLAARRSRTLHRGWVLPPTEPEKVAELASKRQGPTNYGFVIHDYESMTVAGYIDITNIVRGPFQSAYLGYYIFKGFERRGYMKWALGVVIQKAWKELKLHRLEANIQPGNTASIALVKALGFNQEGYSPAYLKIGGRWCDHERWAILAAARRGAVRPNPSAGRSGRT